MPGTTAHRARRCPRRRPAQSGRRVGVNHSTMFRRLTALERQRSAPSCSSGWPPATARPNSGQRLSRRPSAWKPRRWRSTASSTGRDTRLTGPVRVTASETMAFGVHDRRDRALSRAHPGILVDLLVGRQPHARPVAPRGRDRLPRRRPAEGDLFGRKLTDVAWRSYASLSLSRRARQTAQPARLDKQDMIGWGRSDAADQGRRLAEQERRRQPVRRSPHRQSDQPDAGGPGRHGPRPCCRPILGGGDANLVPVMATLADLRTELWR